VARWGFLHIASRFTANERRRNKKLGRDVVTSACCNKVCRNSFHRSIGCHRLVDLTVSWSCKPDRRKCRYAQMSEGSKDNFFWTRGSLCDTETEVYGVRGQLNPVQPLPPLQNPFNLPREHLHRWLKSKVKISGENERNAQTQQIPPSYFSFLRGEISAHIIMQMQKIPQSSL